MPFAVRFLNARENPSASSSPVIKGEFQLGDHRESFESFVGHWTRRDYERQWREALIRVAVAHESSALVTSIAPPGVSDIMWWWPLYPIEGDLVAVRQQLLMLNSLAMPFDETDLYRHVLPYSPFDEDGNRLSQWLVQRGDVERFLRETSTVTP